MSETFQKSQMSEFFDVSAGCHSNNIGDKMTDIYEGAVTTYSKRHFPVGCLLLLVIHTCP